MGSRKIFHKKKRKFPAIEITFIDAAPQHFWCTDSVCLGNGFKAVSFCRKKCGIQTRICLYKHTVSAGHRDNKGIIDITAINLAEIPDRRLEAIEARQRLAQGTVYFRLFFHKMHIPHKSHCTPGTVLADRNYTKLLVKGTGLSAFSITV